MAGKRNSAKSTYTHEKSHGDLRLDSNKEMRKNRNLAKMAPGLLERQVQNARGARTVLKSLPSYLLHENEKYAVNEGFAFAAADKIARRVVEPPFLRYAIKHAHPLSAWKYRKCYSTFQDLLNKYPYRVVACLAETAINRSEKELDSPIKLLNEEIGRLDSVDYQALLDLE
jgi:acyl-homoserine lactone acylase PvdQ